ALMHELRDEPMPSIQEMLSRMARVDLVVVEGFKFAPYSKIEVHRIAAGKPLLFPDDGMIVGVATDATLDIALPVAHLDDISAIAAMMERTAIDIADLDRVPVPGLRQREKLA